MNDVTLSSYRFDGVHRWSDVFGGASGDFGQSVAVDPSGNAVVTGSFNNEVDFGGGLLSSASTSSDIFIAKYSPSGGHLWSQRFGGTGSDVSLSVAVDTDGSVVVAGYFNTTANFGGSSLTSAGGIDIFVAKYSSSGQHLWSRRFGGSGNDYPRTVTIDSSGDILVTGEFVNTLNFGGSSLTSAGNSDIFVAKYSPLGQHLWSQRFGSTGVDVGYGIAVDVNNDVLVTGYFSNTANFGGSSLTSAGGYDVFVAKYSPSGQHLWSQRFGGSGYDYGRAIAVDQNTGEAIVTGYFQGVMDVGAAADLISSGSFDIFLLNLAP